MVRRKRYLENKQYEDDRNKLYYVNNRQAVLDYGKDWFKGNKDSVVLKRKNRRDSDPIVKFIHNTRSLISCSFSRSKKISKPSKTEEILGCSLEFFRLHIESLFAENMSLENHGQGEGKWNIDHKIPIYSAKTKEDIIKLCHYTNLQPMWALDNISKGSKLI